MDEPDSIEALGGSTILITGADGMLGRAFVQALAPLRDSIDLHAHSRRELDVSDADAVRNVRCAPALIIHCAAMSIADECEKNPEDAWRVHVEGTRNVCELAREHGARVFYPQTFLIFDGTSLPVTESTIPAPGHVYGRVKLEAERIVLTTVPRSLVGRLAGFFGGDEKDKNFVGKFVPHAHDLIERGVGSMDVGDRVWQPTYTLDIARNVLLLLLGVQRDGVYNISSHGEATFFDVASHCAMRLGLDAHLTLQPVSSEVFDRAEAVVRPRRVVMSNTRLAAEGLDRQRSWQAALDDYLQRPYFDRFRRA